MSTSQCSNMYIRFLEHKVYNFSVATTCLVFCMVQEKIKKMQRIQEITNFQKEVKTIFISKIVNTITVNGALLHLS